MKYIKIIFSATVIVLASCTDNQNLKNEITQLKSDNALFKKKLDSLNKDYVIPFRSYQDVIMNELKSNPDSIINSYNKIIDKYPNSYWSHEAKRRIENIEKRREYWTKEKGWNFSAKNKMSPTFKKPTYEEVVMERTISCPGC